MPNLLIAMDHAFLQSPEGVFDTLCYDQAFFADYLRAFDAVEAVSRLAAVENLPPRASRSDRPGLTFRGVPNVHGMRWFLGAKRLAGAQILEACRRADAVVARVPSQLGYLAGCVARRLGKPYMIEVISDPWSMITQNGRSVMHRLAAQREMRRLRSLALHASVGSYVTSIGLPAAYPIPADRPQDFISSLRLPAALLTGPREFLEPPRPLRVIYVANMLRHKRHCDLLAACRMAIDAGAPVEIHFVGDGPCRVDLDAQTRQLGLENTVVFHGHLSQRSEVFAKLDGSDLFVTPSAAEGLPRALLEAMARGLPAAGAAADGVPEAVRASELFTVADLRAMASLMIALARDPARLTAMSRHSVQTAARYTSEQLTPKRLRLYAALRDLAAPVLRRAA